LNSSRCASGTAQVAFVQVMRMDAIVSGYHRGDAALRNTGDLPVERQRVEGICRAKLGFAGGGAGFVWLEYHFLHLAAHPLAIPGRST